MREGRKRRGPYLVLNSYPPQATPSALMDAKSSSAQQTQHIKKGLSVQGKLSISIPTLLSLHSTSMTFFMSGIAFLSNGIEIC